MNFSVNERYKRKGFLRRRTKQQQNLYYATLAISFISITLLSAFVIQKSKQEAELLMKGTIDGMALGLIAAYYQGYTDEYIRRNGKFTGIVIYQQGGPTAYKHGEITRDPRLDWAKSKGSMHIDHKKDLVAFHYNLESLTQKLPAGTPLSPNLSPANNVVFHLETTDEKYFKTIRNLNSLRMIIHLFTLLIFSQMILLFIRSNRLQRQLKSQENLVILGSALRTLTHEMKNPLAAIRLQSGYIQKLFPRELKGETDVINQEVLRLSHLMETVKDYLREPLGDQIKIDLISFMEELKQFNPEGIRWQIPQETKYVFFDRDKLRSVMENLINNALESDCAPEEISISVTTTPRFGEIAIRDQGKGIPQELQDRLFDPFFTTKSNGNGVGLIIVRRFLDAAGGRIQIESSEGKGTLVLVRLPFIPNE